MHDKHSKTYGVKVAEPANVPFLQTPPDMQLTIWKADGTTPLIRMAAIGNTRKDAYQANTEYWRHGDVRSDLNVSSLKLSCESFPANYTATHVDTFFDNWTTNAIVSARTNATWTAGRRADTSGRDLYLFSMADPESTSHKLGFLLEVEQSSPFALKAVAFYKSWSPSTRLIYPASVLPLDAVSLSRTTDGQGRNTTDPAYFMLFFHTLME